MTSGWIGVDLDGTLAEYHGWKGIEHIGPPIPAMVERVKDWVAKGIRVKIFTARVSCQETEKQAAERVIYDWSLKHLGMILEVTNMKDFGMIELWDDRAVQVRINTGEPVGFSTRGL